MLQVDQITEKGLDEAIWHVGPYTPEFVEAAIPSDEILDSKTARDGIIRSLTINAKGRTYDGTRKFDPAHPYTYDAVASAAAEEPRSIKRTNGNSPGTFHIGLDIPDRTDLLQGDYRVKNIGLFLMGAANQIARTAGADVIVSKSTDYDAGTLTYSSSDEVDGLYTPLTEPNKEVLPYDRVSKGGVQGLLELIAREVIPKDDAVFLFSDFHEGYDEENDAFSWENELQILSSELGDRLWPIRVVSPGHFVLTEGIVDGLELDMIRKINDSFAETAEKKDAKIDQVLSKLEKYKKINTVRSKNSDHPVRLITRFMLENF